MLIAMLGTVLTVVEPEPPAVPLFRWGAFARALLEPFKSRDFSWVFWTRFAASAGRTESAACCSIPSSALVARTVSPNLGYTVLFVLAFIYLLLGTVFVRQIRGAR